MRLRQIQGVTIWGKSANTPKVGKHPQAMIALFLLASMLASSDISDTTIDTTSRSAPMVDTGRVLFSTHRSVGLGIQKHRDSIPALVKPTYSVSRNPVAEQVLLGIRFADGCVGGRFGIGDGIDSGTSYLIGFDYINHIGNQSFDSTSRTRTESNGFRISMVREHSYWLFPKTTIFLDLGAAYKWQAEHVDSTELSHWSTGHGDRNVSSSSDWSKQLMIVIGLGTRLKLSPSLSLSGGLLFQPAWTTTTSHPQFQKNHTGTQFDLNVPDWNIGLDWNFSLVAPPESPLVKM